MPVILGMAQELFERATMGDDSVANYTLDSQNRESSLLGSIISLMVIMIIFMAARIYCRAYLLRKMREDDWCMILAAIFAICLVVCSILGQRHREESWQDSVYSRKLGYFGQIFYFLSLGLCKISLLLFVIRLTPSERLALVSYYILGFCAVFTTASFIASCLQCIPVPYTWDQLNPNIYGTTKGVCMNQKALQFTLSAINIVTDCVVWLLPVKMVWNIRLPPRERWSLIAVFSFGGLGVVAGVFRLYISMNSGHSSWNYLAIIIWSNVEVLVSITCGSAPVVKPFFSRYIPGLLGVSSGKPCSRSNGPVPGHINRRDRQNTYMLGSMSRVEHSPMEQFGEANVGVPGGVESEGGERSVEVLVLVEERV